MMVYVVCAMGPPDIFWFCGCVSLPYNKNNRPTVLMNPYTIIIYFQRNNESNRENEKQKEKIKKKKEKRLSPYSTDSTDKLLSLTVVAIISDPLRS